MLYAITFDFWGTLYQHAYARDGRLRLLEETLTRHDQPRPWAALEAAYNHVLSVWERIWKEERRSITFEHWMHELLTYLNVDLPAKTVADLRQPMEDIYLESDEPQPIPGIGEILSRLSQRYRLGVISDTGLTPGRALRQVLQRDGLLHHFSILTFSDESGVTKPHPEQFLRTLNVLRTQPEKAVHIGDLPETDIVGAQGVGMKAILFLGVSNRQDGISLADAAFEKYDELEKLLERLE